MQLLQSVADETAAMQSQWTTSIETFNGTSVVFSHFLQNATKNSLLSRVSTNVYFDLNVTDPVLADGTDFYKDVTKMNVNSKQATAVTSFHAALQNFTGVGDMFRSRSIAFQQVLLSYKARQKVSFMFTVIQRSTTIATQKALVSSCRFRFRFRFRFVVEHLLLLRLSSLNAIVDICKQWHP